MDWEIYDLDADEIVIRRPLFARPWGDAHSSKPMPRAAGSVNRARRCEHVQELKRFCEDNKTAVPAAGQRTLRQHASCDGHTRNLREAASGSSLRGERDRKHSRPRLRLRTVLSSERSPDGRRRFQALKSPRNLSSTSLHRPGSSCQSPLSAGADRVNSIGRKDLDCECYYPGVTVLPLVRNSLVSVWELPSTMPLPVEESLSSWGSVGSLIRSRRVPRKAVLNTIARKGRRILQLSRRWMSKTFRRCRFLSTPGMEDGRRTTRLRMARGLFESRP